MQTRCDKIQTEPMKKSTLYKLVYGALTAAWLIITYFLFGNYRTVFSCAFLNKDSIIAVISVFIMLSAGSFILIKLFNIKKQILRCCIPIIISACFILCRIPIFLRTISAEYFTQKVLNDIILSYAYAFIFGIIIAVIIAIKDKSFIKTSNT